MSNLYAAFNPLLYGKGASNFFHIKHRVTQTNIFVHRDVLSQFRLEIIQFCTKTWKKYQIAQCSAFSQRGNIFRVSTERRHSIYRGVAISEMSGPDPLGPKKNTYNTYSYRTLFSFSLLKFFLQYIGSEKKLWFFNLNPDQQLC